MAHLASYIREIRVREHEILPSPERTIITDRPANHSTNPSHMFAYSTICLYSYLGRFLRPRGLGRLDTEPKRSRHPAAPATVTPAWSN